jgi:hypothetical protein
MKAMVFSNLRERPCNILGYPARVDPALSVLDKASLDTESLPHWP